jgi:hypothetical protein
MKRWVAMKQSKMIDRDQAATIEQHLLEVEGALNQACEAILRLGGEARTTFGIPLNDAASDLRFGLLKLLYDQFPDLKPPPEIPVISSTLAWADVCLPPSITEADIDSVILSVITAQWRKTAAIVGKAYDKCRELGWPSTTMPWPPALKSWPTKTGSTTRATFGTGGNAKSD